MSHSFPVFLGNGSGALFSAISDTVLSCFCRGFPGFAAGVAYVMGMDENIAKDERALKAEKNIIKKK